MKLPFLILYFIVLISPKILLAQYEFSGYVDKKNWSGDIYLSLIEDYRKLSGVYPEQIIQKTVSDSMGYFSFSGDNLPLQNHMYRIHIEGCSEDEKKPIHFNGFCPYSKEILFIANNTDALTLPFSFDNEMFCKIVSNNEKSNAFIKVDSIIGEMRFAFASYRSEANRKINEKKWFATLQGFVKDQNEPLTELYVYAFLSDKSNNLYAHYLEDLEQNVYYDNLLERLQKKYPSSTYTKRYEAELASDKFMISPKEVSYKNLWLWVVLACAIVLNIFQFLNYRKKVKTSHNSEKNLTQQEQKVLDLILDDKTNKEIASTMFVSISTIKTHINNLYKKLDVSSRDEVKSLNIKK
ncbi:response regulator transcription factor [Aquimarina macrocephali]|uniref:response regulator transcription factor n=1 Tax=Aquimarina macrocephali TaxID=666563 RepID=UPI00046698CB|nr:LuxR C-terminal-related transcriptional regulator [Aquimarina macrocephali]